MQQRLRQAIGEILVVCVVRHVDERQHRHRRVIDVFHQLPRAEQTDEHNDQRDAGERHIVDQPVPLHSHAGIVGNVLVALDAVWRQLKEPRQHDRGEKAQHEDVNDRRLRPPRRAELRQDRRQYLGEQPAHDEVGGSDTKDIAAPEFGG